jgi:serine/threonine-protein kinase
MSDQPPASDSDSATIIADTYRLESGVARGGFSTVYRASHTEMDRPVALKVLKIDDDIEATALERFSQEARLTCAVNHPHVVTIYEFGQDPRGLLYIAMEWLDGESLKECLDETERLEPARVARLGGQLARGLGAAHRQDVLHRDLKPSNIMLTELPIDGEHAKVLDFGVAETLEPPTDEQLQITHDGMFVGTPRYAAPEQIRGEQLSPRTDVYALGLLMWEAVTGEPAVPTTEFQECCRHHLSESAWELPDELDMPTKLRETIERCLRKDPDRRFGSCAEVAEALDSLTTPRRPSLEPSGSRDRSRRRWLKAVLVLSLATSLLLLVVLLATI